MGCGSQYIYKPGRCPSCGLEGGAIMGCSYWEHDFSCCSEACGLAIKEIVEKNEASEEFQKLQNELWTLQEKIRERRCQGIKFPGSGASNSFFSEILG